MARDGQGVLKANMTIRWETAALEASRARLEKTMPEDNEGVLRGR